MSESDFDASNVDLSDFGYKDVRFFEAVKEINENPEDYDNTEQSKVPANTTSIREFASLSKSEVSYRLGGRRANHAGYDQNGQGLIRVHEAQPHKGRMGPKSAELTEKGIRVLNLVKQEHGLSGSGGQGDVADDVGAQIADVQQAMNELEAEVAELGEQLERLEDSEVGGLGEKYARVLESVATGFPAHDQIFSEVFGIETAEFRGEADPETVKEQREQALEALQDQA